MHALRGWLSVRLGGISPQGMRATTGPLTRELGADGGDGVVERMMPPEVSSERSPGRVLSKRLFDVSGAVLLLLLLLPLMALIALSILTINGRPVLFGHRRIGFNGQSFRCWKFRTMFPDADRRLTDVLARDANARQEWQTSFKLRRDPRVTPVGRFLRRTSLDELPQLYNVMIGEMSIIGPRPIVPDEISRYGNGFAAYCRCRPGITGLWQVNGRTELSYQERVRYDIAYCCNWSHTQDFQILAKTVVVVLTCSGSY